MNERNYESECESDLEKDDAAVLSKRYAVFINAIDSYKKKEDKHKKTRLRAQWTKMHDAVQEHFTSHVMINGTTHLLPPNIYALKQTSKQSWMLYKKRECERRKRLRQKIEKEKKVEESGGPANLLLSMVDSCEVCKKFYITVNLFWGVTLCDVCYFNEEVIHEIMSAKKKQMSSSASASSSSAKIISHPQNRLLASAFSSTSEKWKEKYFSVPPSPPPPVISTSALVSLSSSSEEEIIVEENSNQFDEVDSEDIRPISLYKGLPTPPGSPYQHCHLFGEYGNENSIQKICEEIINMPDCDSNF